MWGHGMIEWTFRGAVGRSGGILSIWNGDNFSASSCWHMEGAVNVNGVWGRVRINCCLINIYAPCLLSNKIDLWDRVQQVISQNMPKCLCIAGDFNSIRRESERAGRRSESVRRDVEVFDEFIHNSGLIDLPLHGRIFTWYRPDGSCKSRLDRAMINNRWLSQSPNSSQLGLPRSLSDHCPILLEEKSRDWGPKPFRWINAWINHPGFIEFVKER